MQDNHLSQLKLSQLRALVAVADQGNFGEAALELGISQSAVSHAIATLEDALGVVLFSRGRSGAQLTPVGEEVVTHARQVLRSLDAMTKVAAAAKGLQGGQVRVAAFRSAATHLVPKAIAQFQQRFPAIGVTIREYYDFVEVDQALRAGQADVGFTILPTREGFKTWELLDDEFVVLLADGIPMRHAKQFSQQGNRLTWEQLTDYPLICLEDAVHIQFLNNLYLKLGKTLNIAYRVRQASTLLSMVAQGLGAAVFPRLAAEPIPLGVQVYRLAEPLSRTIGVAIVADALHSPAVFAFLETLGCRV
ncbi:LysR family transcriptional regulator [Oscillatoria sp. FACHB-1407]|uniref:LysR family transcriptional regulator n=1 Tax=Oscillatoria sp. FACHB-1407 TaxID=2692847 RepID=UPI00168997F0|nr:LysR family transcriptional regulator [Oscillatoria sp. FACHB-1407]MBD2465834.1 LysR family transcriptional regulator [Oscillatoria sp. FACHB-1407]